MAQDNETGTDNESTSRQQNKTSTNQTVSVLSVSTDNKGESAQPNSEASGNGGNQPNGSASGNSANHNDQKIDMQKDFKSNDKAEPVAVEANDQQPHDNAKPVVVVANNQQPNDNAEPVAVEANNQQPNDIAEPVAITFSHLTTSGYTIIIPAFVKYRNI
eukprot:CAMPEP_0114663392 /NCGR_PEP_ID=MMETSP0191-20121206/26813_1 /TAXON_ID=126664 /ORGANISM="Sorites sp." /LENGTH=159 /DNA_ID=CAMNT_0001902591 /DNA_START=340 /DNA_END=818 /DNA_ORIENTATION=-